MLHELVGEHGPGAFSNVQALKASFQLANCRGSQRNYKWRTANQEQCRDHSKQLHVSQLEDRGAALNEQARIGQRELLDADIQGSSVATQGYI